jgi:hypothetical protein
MSDQLLAVAISGTLSLIGAFGSILLKDRLERRRDEARAHAAESATPAAPTCAPTSPSSTRPLKIAMVALYAGIGLAIGCFANDLGAAVLLVFLPPLLILWFFARGASRSLAGYQATMPCYWAGILGGEMLRGASNGSRGIPAYEIEAALGWGAAWAFGGLVLSAIARSLAPRA